MPVSTLHPEVESHVEEWQTIEDCLSGESAIKDAGIRYLPQGVGVSDKAYSIYKKRASWFGATARTFEAMMGFLFRKPPTMELGEGIKGFEEDADLTSSGIIAYSRRVAGKVASVGRCGTLIDWADGEDRPYFAFYDAPAITNWRTERIGGNLKLTGLVLKECILEAAQNDQWERSVVTYYREILLLGDRLSPKSLQCVVNIYREPSNTESGRNRNAPGTGAPGQPGGPELLESRTMSRRNKALDFIPFVFHNAEQPGECISRPPLGDLANVNISHYGTSADLEQGRHWCGCPTPWRKCFGDPDAEPGGADAVEIGPNVLWDSENEHAACGFLEFTGEGLTALENALKEKQQQMASLGARLIEPKGGDAKAYETVALEASAESSTLARVGMLCSESITVALQIADWWAGSSEEIDTEIKFDLNNDFSSAALQFQMLAGLISAWSTGAISQHVMMHNFRRGELYPAGWTDEDEKEAIEMNPAMPTPATAPQLIAPGKNGEPAVLPIPVKKPAGKPPAKED